ncbi:hypothetical protein RhiirC2_800372 [Rhizophagus irregularis]|uniref:Protein kinase domain-containing protein n=1 Tax=Rhizophagus irregularis TaxID=588596 RepID=A0A2N1M3R0_9GLOM|nr:hypothetical protein RhiirC2_800372 [Rhizophagus irregularis]
MEFNINSTQITFLIERSTTSLYLLNKKSAVYSIGVLLWEISSCILQGLRETPIHDTPEEYLRIYTDCWNIEPDNRPTINQVVDELKVLVLKTKDNIIKDFNLNDNNKDIQSSTNQQPTLNVKISEKFVSLHGDLSQVIQNFNMTNIDDVETSISSNNANNDNNKDIQSSTNQQPILNVAISENIDSLHGDLSQVIQNFNMMMNTDDIKTLISSNNISENNFNM